ncbi:PQQ-binding-like beta-propeller repeat protein [Zavarzinella formosa]|uniref:PQQ-binding-like beta-propeller repeat protein n=1 Tax=Zavarzinella formosa TaxID=360055 RepID=UPI00030B7A47|nr:PQQ-binding-like beta-propeller repeat protein [Zavarzinella formosa]
MRIVLTLLCSLMLTGLVSADDWPQWMGPKRDNTWRETGIIESIPKAGLKPLWKVKVAGGYAGPAVAGGKVYLADFVSSADPKQEVYERTNYKGTERLICFDAKTGKELWKYEQPATYTISFPNGPRCTPAVADGKVYALGAEGHLACLDAVTGKPLWTKDFNKDYATKTPLWGYASHPFIDGKKLICIVGGEGACVVAFDKDSGKELWKNLTAREPGYSSPGIIEAGGARQLLVWHSESVNSLDPETGKKFWSSPLKATNAGAVMVPSRDGEHLFVGGYDGVCKGFRLTTDQPGAEEIWIGDRRKGVYPVNSQPFVENGLLYGIDSKGELRCMEMATGKRLWESLEPVGGKAGQCATAFLVKNGDRFFIFNELGEILIAKLTREGYQETGRTKIIEPTGHSFGRDLMFSMPAFAEKCVFVRSDRELICVSLAKE